jgi:tRNA acetyltransferase TAN1
VIDAVADLVPKGEWSVDLSTPDLTIAVEVIKGTCCLSVLREYYGMLKYNWRMLGLSDEERAAERARGTTTDRNTEKTTTSGGADDGKRAGENDA